MDKWDELRQQLLHLKRSGVDNLDPLIVVLCMDFIEHGKKAEWDAGEAIQELKEQLPKNIVAQL